MKRKRIAIYARTSTRERQELGNQLHQLRDFAQAQGWSIVAEFVDQESGSKSDRPQFLKMMEAAGRRDFDLLLFWALDRLTREGALQALLHLNRLTSHGVAYRSLTESYLDSAGIFGEAIIAVLSTLAKQERLRLSERVRAGLERARRDGTRSGKAIGRPQSVFRRDQVKELREQGLSWSEIATVMEQPVSTIRRAFRQQQEQNL